MVGSTPTRFRQNRAFITEDQEDTQDPEEAKQGEETTEMLLPSWGLFAVCGGVGILGLLLAYKRNWAAVLPVLLVLVVAAVTIIQLRDPLGLPRKYQQTMEDWGYIVALFSSVSSGLVLPVVGYYLGGRGKQRSG